MGASLLGRLYALIRTRRFGRPCFWLLIILCLVWEFYARPILMLEYPGIELPSLRSELLGALEFLGI